MVMHKYKHSLVVSQLQSKLYVDIGATVARFDEVFAVSVESEHIEVKILYQAENDSKFDYF